jgi:protein-disulfide isomerase
MKCLALLLVLTAGLVAPARAAAKAPWQSIPWWGDLERGERERVERLAVEKYAYGPCANQKISACFERGSRLGWRLARVIIYLVQRGAEDQDIRRILDQRRASYDAAPRPINLDGAPIIGGNAKVTVVEFADFECPMCAATTPVLEEVVKSLKGKARLAFKHFPIKGHRNSVAAAVAAVAAGRQGKFWPMAELLFKNIYDHDRKQLEGYATKLGLDLEKFRADFQAPETIKQVEQDKDLGLALGVRATPTLFVNGREFRPMRDRFLLLDRIEEEIDRVAGRK